MFDASVRGWILLAAGAALLLYSGRSTRRRNGGLFGEMTGWGERLIGAGLILQGGSSHFEHFRATELAWLAWVAFATFACGVILVCVAESQRRRSPGH